MAECLICQQPLATKNSWQQLLRGQPTFELCANCEEQIHYSQEKDAIYFYNEWMKKVLHQFKFHQDIRVAAFFAKALKQKLKHYDFDILMPVPMHPLMEKKRTFSHMNAILQAANLPFQQYLAKATPEQQSKKTKEVREKVSQLFTIKTKIGSEKSRILLVDDLVTTGTTRQHATTALYEAGIEKIDFIALISAKK
ncbi:MAG: ComF family protein [Kurthia sp.]|nr:ComF family protein [Candidatus Kurthia equi]